MKHKTKDAKNSQEFFMRIALDEARKALSVGEFPVGCVMVYQDKVIAKGSRASSIGPSSNEIDHAEMITLRRLWESAKKIHPNQITVYCTMEPCLMCFAALILAGIKKIVYAYEDVMGGGTQADLSDLPPLYSASGVLVIPGILRDESLHLFRQFFSNPNNHYWKGSLLEGYTLNHDQHYH